MYIPILKGKPAEFLAWENVSAARRSLVNPVFELTVKDKPTSEIEAFRDGVISSFNHGDSIAIDAVGKMPTAWTQFNGLGIYQWLSSQLSPHGIGFTPVLHLSDSPAQIADALAVSNDLILRVDTIDSNPSPSATDTSLKDWCSTHGILPQNIDVIVDLGGIHGVTIVSLQGVATAHLRWVTANGSWKSVTLASGAFPAKITAVPKRMAYPIPRLDAALFNLVAPTSLIPKLQFGDYGIRDAGVPIKGQPRGPLPNIRYTAANDWLVWREEKHPKYPNSSIYAAYAGIVASGYFKGASFSWGDDVINSKSTAIPSAGSGAGRATEWLAYGLNHHLELVVDRLSTLAVP